MTDHLPHRVVAQRYVGTPWPNFGPEAAALKQMRVDYEEGRVEMAQRREGRMEYQYSIPRKIRGVRRPGYFKPAV